MGIQNGALGGLNIVALWLWLIAGQSFLSKMPSTWQGQEETHLLDISFNVSRFLEAFVVFLLG